MNADVIAPVYDSLSRLVFGNSLYEAAAWTYSFIPSNSKILIVGGGTGTILTDLDKPGAGFMIDYVELSSVMVSLSERRAPFNHIHVNFHQCDIMTWRDGSDYDVIITPFFLDCFGKADLELVMRRLTRLIKSDGFWCFTDFVETKSKWQRALIRLMYLFFRLTTGLTNDRLPDYDTVFRANSLRLTAVQTFYHGMIESRLYQPVS
jgi:ubiquinone/menaquinone biosynthesis C-methylase UbiE